MMHLKQSSDTSTRNTEDCTVSSRSEDDILTTKRSGSLCAPAPTSPGLQSNRDSFSSSLSPISPHKRKVNDLSCLTVDKLRFSSLELHGRDDEKLKLFQEFEFLVQNNSSSERRLLLISGKSGTGKTKLAETLREPVTRRNGMFVKGKFDLNLRNQPYSGIANACAEICGAILMLQRQEPARVKTICDDIHELLNNELYLLVQTVPVLAEIVVFANVANENSKSPATHDSKNRIIFAFVRLFRIFAKHFFPLIFVLDDLQWADTSSLDLLEVLTADHQGHKFMLIGIYRSNEVNETHIFHRYLQDLEAKSVGKHFTMAKLQISDLGLANVNTIIQHLLRCDDSRTLGLAHVCFKKTLGNPFYLIKYLSMLHEDQLLQFNFGTLSWIWNDEEIELRTQASDNVVDLLQKRMMELPGQVLDILKIAACLGSTFEQRLLRLVWSKLFNVTGDEPRVEKKFVAGIDKLMNEELFVKVSEIPPRLCWVHDKIHEAAISLVPSIDRKQYHSRVGEILASELEDDELDSVIFVVVDLLNMESAKLSNDEKTRLRLACLNLKACRKAVRLSAFESAALYAGHGILMLPRKAWEDDYHLCLELYSMGARAESFVGNVWIMEKYCQAVLSQKHKPIEDKFDVYNTLIDKMANEGKVEEAQKLLLKILGRFKCRFPKNPALIGLGVLYNIVRIQRTMKSRETSKLVVMSNSTRVQLMQLLDKLATCLYMSKDSRLPLVIFRSLNWTIKYGNCSYSPPAFATTGMILTGAVNDLQGGSKYGQHALTLMNMLQSDSSSARTVFLVYTFVFPWTQQAMLLFKPLLQAYDIGLRTGDTESAMYSIFTWLLTKFIIGSPLDSLRADLDLYVQQMKDLKRDQALKMTKCLHQAILNLIHENDSSDFTHFAGEALSEDELHRAKKDSLWMSSVYTYHGALFTYFGEHIRNAEMAFNLGHDFLEKAMLAFPNVMLDTFLKGVSCFAAARQTRKSKYIKLAKINRSKIKKWLAMGNPNVKHYDSFLEAEALALKGKSLSVVKQYELTIVQAARSGYQQDAALASERLGEYQLFVLNDYEEGAFRLREAEKYWRGWGALAKVQQLEAKYPKVFRALPSRKGIYTVLPTGEIFSMAKSSNNGIENLA